MRKTPWLMRTDAGDTTNVREKSAGSDLWTSIEFGSKCRFSLTINLGKNVRLRNVAALL
jgi:hypothetical protein